MYCASTRALETQRYCVLNHRDSTSPGKPYRGGRQTLSHLRPPTHTGTRTRSMSVRHTWLSADGSHLGLGTSVTTDDEWMSVISCFFCASIWSGVIQYLLSSFTTSA